MNNLIMIGFNVPLLLTPLAAIHAADAPKPPLDSIKFSEPLSTTTLRANQP